MVDRLAQHHLVLALAIHRDPDDLCAVRQTDQGIRAIARPGHRHTARSQLHRWRPQGNRQGTLNPRNRQRTGCGCRIGCVRHTRAIRHTTRQAFFRNRRRDGPARVDHLRGTDIDGQGVVHRITILVGHRVGEGLLDHLAWLQAIARFAVKHKFVATIRLRNHGAVLATEIAPGERTQTVCTGLDWHSTGDAGQGICGAHAAVNIEDVVCLFVGINGIDDIAALVLEALQSEDIVLPIDLHRDILGRQGHDIARCRILRTIGIGRFGVVQLYLEGNRRHHPVNHHGHFHFHGDLVQSGRVGIDRPVVMGEFGQFEHTARRHHHAIA